MFSIGRRDLIRISKALEILISYTRELSLQRIEVVLAIACTQRHTEKAHDEASSMISSHLNDTPDIILMIGQEGKQRIQPYTGKHMMIS